MLLKRCCRQISLRRVNNIVNWHYVRSRPDDHALRNTVRAKVPCALKLKTNLHRRNHEFFNCIIFSNIINLVPWDKY